VTDVDIDAHTLRIRALELRKPAATGPTGPAGPAGPQGPAGPTGPASSTSFFQTFSGSLTTNGSGQVGITFNQLTTIAGIIAGYVGPYGLATPVYSTVGNYATVDLRRLSDGTVIPNQAHWFSVVAWGPKA